MDYQRGGVSDGDVDSYRYRGHVTAEDRGSLARLSGQGHEARARDGADLGFFVLNPGDEQFRISSKKKWIFNRQRMVSDERVTLTHHLEKNLLSQSNVQIKSESFFAGV